MKLHTKGDNTMLIIEDNNIYQGTVTFTDNLLKQLAQNPYDPDLIWLLGDNLIKANKHAEKIQLVQMVQEPKPVKKSLLDKFIGSITDPFYLNDFPTETTKKYVNAIAHYDPLIRNSKLLTDQSNIAENTIWDITNSKFELADSDLRTWTLLVHGLILANLTGRQDKFFDVVRFDKKVIHLNNKLEDKKSAYSWVGYDNFRDHPVTEEDIDTDIVGPVRIERDQAIEDATKKAILLVNGETVAELINKIARHNALHNSAK